VGLISFPLHRCDILLLWIILTPLVIITPLINISYPDYRENNLIFNLIFNLIPRLPPLIYLSQNASSRILSSTLRTLPESESRLQHQLQPHHPYPLYSSQRRPPTREEPCPRRTRYSKETPPRLRCQYRKVK
jgi:hypothetical protein